MMQNDQTESPRKPWTRLESIFLLWTGLALVALLPITLFLRAAFPLLTVPWLLVPLLVVLFRRDATPSGFRSIPWRAFLVTAAINLGLLLLIAALVEPWSHAYRSLVQAALASTPPDTTFAWLVRFSGLKAWAGLLLYSGLVTIFAEELFFRGWLLQALLPRMNKYAAILIQAALFTLPQLLAALVLPPLQGLLYAVVYSFLAIGVVGGWAAARTGSIWPSLAAAAISNTLFVLWTVATR